MAHKKGVGTPKTVENQVKTTWSKDFGGQFAQAGNIIVDKGLFIILEKMFILERTIHFMPK